MIKETDMTRPWMTIVIPAYNAEKTLEKCLNSIENQKMNDCEILVVENGSTDRTSQIANGMKNISLLHSEKGVSLARNTGIENAKGDWITFLDADDALIENSLIELKQKFAQCQMPGDMITLGIHGISQEHPTFTAENQDEIDGYIEACLCTPTKKANNHGVVYRSEFLQKNHLQFDSSLRYGEDSEFFIRALLSAKCVMGWDIDFYKVNYNEESTIHHVKNSMVPEYTKTIAKLDADLQNKASFKNAFNLFVLHQMLIVMVHETLTDSRHHFSDNVAAVRKLSHCAPFQVAIDQVDLSGQSGAVNIVFHMLKKKFYPGVVWAVKLRQSQNKRKSNTL